MLKRLLNLFQPASQSVQAKRQIIPRDQHGISRRDIHPSAIKVMKRLIDAGFEAYLVGGGVRDLLLEGNPKDFDIATDAAPEQIKRMFRGARIVGRRFKIVHVRMGREMFEVTTFRGHHSDAQSKQQSSQSDEGMLLRDNVYGDVESDAVRRDFTVNALYYTIDGFAVHDFTGGMKDIKHRQLRMIGDPITRYREDPVRLLRAVRFGAKLGFQIEANTAAPIRDHGELLSNIASARFYDEVLKLLMGGSATASLALLREYNLFGQLFPGTETALANQPELLALIEQAMINTDKRIRQELRVTPAFLFAVLLWPQLIQRMQSLQDTRKMPVIPALHQAAQDVIGEQCKRTAIPKRFTAVVREIWDLQWRLERRGGRRAEVLIQHQKFRAGYDFILLREQAGEDLGGLGDWWTRYQEADEPGRLELVKQLKPEPKSGRRRRRKPKAKKPQSSDNNS